MLRTPVRRPKAFVTASAFSLLSRDCSSSVNPRPSARAWRTARGRSRAGASCPGSDGRARLGRDGVVAELAGRQREREDAALAGDARDRDPAAVLLDDALADG